jgi:hypothetical protein
MAVGDRLFDESGEPLALVRRAVSEERADVVRVVAVEVLPLDRDLAVRLAARDLLDRRRGGLEQRCRPEGLGPVDRVSGVPVCVGGVLLRVVDAVQSAGRLEVRDELRETGVLGRLVEPVL